MPDRPADLEPRVATLIRARGSTLLDGLELHLPGSREHADATASYASAAAAELGFERGHADAVREVALHEAGMVYLPAAMLSKAPSELSDEERERRPQTIDRPREGRGGELDPQAVDALTAVLARAN